MTSFEDSMTFRGVNLRKEFGIRVVAHNSLLPPLRARKVLIPLRSGMRDYGARYHDERTYPISCVLERAIADAEMDRLKLLFSKKGKLIVFDQPDRYYMAQSYDALEVINHFNFTAREFEMNFICEPYAYALSPTTVKTNSTPIIPLAYEGTQETPARIVIRNTGSTQIINAMLIARRRSTNL